MESVGTAHTARARNYNGSIPCVSSIIYGVAEILPELYLSITQHLASLRLVRIAPILKHIGLDAAPSETYTHIFKLPNATHGLCLCPIPT